jgi:hypothetical protein
MAVFLAVFVTFLAHKPACSESRMLHNRPVPAFRALTADIDVKTAIGAVAQVASPIAVLAAGMQIESPVAEVSPTLEVSSPRALLSCLLC